jgi:hypothetical protein
VATPSSAPQEPVALQAGGPKTLGGLRRTSAPGTGDGTGWLYLLIVVGGVVVFGGQAALSRFAVTRG